MLGFKLPERGKISCEDAYFDDLPKFNMDDVKDQVLIGSGTFGDVFRGLHSGKDVVVKKLKGMHSRQAKLLSKEAKLIQNCSGSNFIVELEGISTQPLALMLPFEVFKFKPVDGASSVEISALNKFLEFVDEFNLAGMENYIPIICRQVAEGVKHMHKQGNYTYILFYATFQGGGICPVGDFVPGRI